MATTPFERLRHIKEAIRAARDGVGGLNPEVVAENPFLLGGLSYQLLVITEAARNIPPEWQRLPPRSRR